MLTVGAIVGLVVFVSYDDPPLPIITEDTPATVTQVVSVPVPYPVRVPEEITVDISANVPVDNFEVTAYTAGPESTGKAPGHPEYGITASGERVKPDYTIACPPTIPFGTRIYIPYFDNTYVCEDRGSAITAGKLDVYMPDLADARAFGRRDLDVIVLTEESEADNAEGGDES